MSDTGPDVEKLRKYLLSPQKKPERKAALIKAHLLQQPEPWARQLLLDVLAANRDEKVLRHAIRALGYRQDPTLVDELAPLTARAESHVLAHLVKAVLRLDRPRGITLIRQMIETRDDPSRMVALVALSRVDPRAVVPLMGPLVEAPSTATRRATAELLGGVLPPGGVELALPWIRREKEPPVLEALSRYLRREMQAPHRLKLQEILDLVKKEEPVGSPRRAILEKLAGASGEIALSSDTRPDDPGGPKARQPRAITKVIPQDLLDELASEGERTGTPDLSPGMGSSELDLDPGTTGSPTRALKPLAEAPAPSRPSDRTQDTRPFDMTDTRGTEARPRQPEAGSPAAGTATRTPTRAGGEKSAENAGVPNATAAKGIPTREGAEKPETGGIPGATAAKGFPARGAGAPNATAAKGIPTRGTGDRATETGTGVPTATAAKGIPTRQEAPRDGADAATGPSSAATTPPGDEPWTDRLFAFFLGGVSVACLLVLGLLWLTEPVAPVQKPRPEPTAGEGYESHPALGARGARLTVEGSLINLNQQQGYLVLQLEKPIVVSIYFPAGFPKEPFQLGAGYKASGTLRHIESEQLVVLEADSIEKR